MYTLYHYCVYDIIKTDEIELDVELKLVRANYSSVDIFKAWKKNNFGQSFMIIFYNSDSMFMPIIMKRTVW